MNQDELKKEISEKKIRNLYIFNSDDYFLKRTYIDRLSKSEGIGIQKFFYVSFEQFSSDIANLCSDDLFSEKVIKHVRLNFELEQLIPINPKNNIIIIDPIKCSNKLKSDSIVNFRPLTHQEIIAYLKSKVKNLDDELLEKISNSSFYNNATALYILAEKLTLSGNKTEIDFLENAISNFEVVDAIIYKNFQTFSSFIDKYNDYPLKLIATFSTIFLNAFLEYYDLNEPSKLYYKRISSILGEKKLESLLSILYDLDKLYKSANVRNLLPLKLKIFYWMVQN